MHAFSNSLQSMLLICFPVFLVIFGVVGLLALISPKNFTTLASKTAHWIDTSKVLSMFDKKIDVDDHVMNYSRVLGGLVVASVAVLTYWYAGI